MNWGPAVIKSVEIKISTCQKEPIFEEVAYHEGVCHMCNVEFNPNEVLGLINCGHTFHVKCLRRRIPRKNKPCFIEIETTNDDACPLCGQTILTKKVEDIYDKYNDWWLDNWYKMTQQ